MSLKDSGVIDEESPTSTLQDQDEQVRRQSEDDAADPTPQPEDNETTSHVDGAEEPTEKSKGKPDPNSAESATDELIQSLVKPEQRKKSAEVKAPEKSDAKPKPDANAKPAGAQEKSDKDDPFDGLSRDDIKTKTRERIVTLHKRATIAETKLTEREQHFAKSEPMLKMGENYTKLFDQYGLNDDLDLVTTDDFAGAIRASAASARALEAISKGYMPHADDLSVLDSVKEAYDQIYNAMGRGETTKPFKGALPEDLQELVDSQVVSEDRARLIAALEAKGKPSGAKEKPAQARELREAPPLRSQPQQRQPAQSQASPQQREEQAAWSMIAAHLSKSGVAPAAIAEHFNKTLSPIIRRLISEELPGTDPKDVPPSFRVEFARRAQAEFAEKSKPKTQPKPVQKQGQPIRATGSGGSAAAKDEPNDGLSYAVSYLTKPK